MVTRILRIFHKEIAGVHQAAFLLGTFTLLSQLLALVRDRMLAGFFGAGHTLDLYYTAFRIPDLIYASVASLVSISVLIPFFSRVMEKNSANTTSSGASDVGVGDVLDKSSAGGADDTRTTDAQKLSSSIFTVFVGVMVTVSVLAFILMPYLVQIFFGGLGDATAGGDAHNAALDELTTLSRLLLLQPICLGISNVFGVITQIGKRFFIYALSPIFYNLSIIFGLVFLYPSYGIRGVVVGVILGGVMHFAIQIPYAVKARMLPRFTLDIDMPTIRQVVRISIPRTLALSANMFELIIITSFASWLVVGSVSIFNLALNLQSVPFAIVGVSYALAAFPTLSACFAKGERQKFMEHIVTAARHIIFWSIPISALFIVLRAQIVRTILGNGYFNWEHTRLTAACLALFVVSLVAQGLELLFIRAYYAAGNTKKPVIINILSSVATIGLPLIFLALFQTHTEFRFFMESLFKVEGIRGAGVLMLPLGYTIGTLLNALAFWAMFEYDFGNRWYTPPAKKVKEGIFETIHVERHTFSAHVLPTLFSSIQAAVVGGFVAYIGLNMFDDVFNLSTLSGIFLQGLCAGLLGIGASVLVFIILKNTEIGEIYNALRQKIAPREKIWKDKIVVSEPDSL